MIEGPAMTALDAAHAAMLSDPEDDFARLRYYRQLADAELFLLLTDEAEGETVSPRLFPLETGPVVLAFDTEERLVEFTGIPSPYAALPGRVVIGQLVGQETGLGINLGTADRAWLMGPEAIGWMAAVLETKPAETRGRPILMQSPGELDPVLAEALAVALSGAGGLAAAAVLAHAGWSDGTQGLVLAYLGASPEAEAALARALAEALAFSGLEGGVVDVVFLAPEDPAARQLRSIGQPLRLPAPPAPPERAPPAPPGMDPQKPPKLR